MRLFHKTEFWVFYLFLKFFDSGLDKFVEVYFTMSIHVNDLDDLVNDNIFNSFSEIGKEGFEFFLSDLSVTIFVNCS